MLLRSFGPAVCLFFFSFLASAQVPPGRITDWSSPGSAEAFVPARVLSFSDFGADDTGNLPCDSSLREAFTALGGPGKLLFAPGIYRFDETLQLPDSVILEGETDTSLHARVVFRLNPGMYAHGIAVIGSETDPGIPLPGNLSQGQRTVYAPQAAALLAPGNSIRLYAMDDSALVFSSWALHQTGQILRIEDIRNDSLVFDKPLRRSYDPALPPRIYLRHPRQQVHLRCINLERLDQTTAQTSNVFFDIATDCSLSGSESYRCNFAHVTVQSSSNITVRNSHFREAFAYGGGGQGYGVALQGTASDCYVYANTFTHLRHSLLLQSGVNGNVLSYNYSKDPFWTESFLPANSSGDLVLHGNYPYMNLFEGNVVQNIVIDNSHGINGPFNTLFRNRAELYGIFMNTSPASSRQNFMGNQVVNGSSPFYGLYTLQGSDHYQQGNTVKGSMQPAGSAEYPAVSLYGYTFPSYYEAYTGIPGIRTDNWLASVPLNEAAYRYLRNQKSVCAEIEYVNPNLAIAESEETELHIYPNPVTEKLFITGEADRLELWSLLGQRCRTQTGSGPLDVADLPAGTYFLRVYRQNVYSVHKVLLLR